MTVTPADSFIDKWLRAEPGHRLLSVFQPPGPRQVRHVLESIGFELRDAALGASDPVVTTTKLAWWQEEWRRLAAGTPRHPLTMALAALPRGDGAGGIDADAGGRWARSALALAGEDSDADLDARLRYWLAYARAQAQASAPWLDDRHDDDDHSQRLHALALLAERLPALADDVAHGRLPLPLSVLAGAGLHRHDIVAGNRAADVAVADYAGTLVRALAGADATGASAWRRGQAELARLYARRIVRHPAQAWSGRRELPRLRAAWAVWRVSRPG